MRGGFDLLGINLSELDLNIRHWRTLEKAGLKTVGDVLAVTTRWPSLGLRSFRGIGPKAAEEIANVVAGFIAYSIAPKR